MCVCMFVFTIIGICKDSQERTEIRLLPWSSWVQGTLPLMTGSGFVTAERHIPPGCDDWKYLHSQSMYPSLDFETVLPFFTESPVAEGRETHVPFPVFLTAHFQSSAGG